MRWLLLLLMLGQAAAVPYQDASLHDERVLSFEPDIPAPGEQWTATLNLVEGHNLSAVDFQICDVGNACFAPPAPMTRTGPNTFQLDTSNYGVGGQVRWGISADGHDWLVGTKFIFTTANGSEGLWPHGVDYDDDVCHQEPKRESFIACDETHYLTFQLAGASDEKAPGLALPILLLALLVLARKR